MKLIVIIMTACLMQVSAAGFAQKLSFSKKGASLSQIFTEIRKQTGYFVIYSDKQVDDNVKLDVNFKNTDLRDVMEVIGKSQSLEYSFAEKNISLKPKDEVGLIDRIIARFQSIDVRGKVVDENGNPLPGASVKAGSKTAITDANGEFNLAGLEEGVIVEVSYLGYKTASLRASGVFMNVQLSATLGQLDEVVINKGYYTTNKELNTGNVSIAKGSDLNKNATGDPLIALTGRISGVYISQTSGIAGSNVRVQLRGRNSIANGNDPLYVIDGVPFASTPITSNAAYGVGGAGAGDLSNFNNINLDNVERIEVLKDADATAIYGSRGANGVILITTKKGMAGATRLNVKVSGGAGRVASKLDLMNTEEYLQMRRAAFANDGITTIPASADDLNGTFGDINKYTDWQKVFIGGTSHITDATASLTGGSDKTQFLVGGGYRKESSVFPGDFRQRKLSFNTNVNHTSGKLNANISVSYVNDNNILPNQDYTTKVTLIPNAPDVYLPNGKFNWQNSAWENPVWSTTETTKNLTENLNSTLNLKYDIASGLSATLRGGYNNIRMKFSKPSPLVDYNPAVIIIPDYRSNNYGSNEIKTWIVEPGLNYSIEIGKGKFESLVGVTFQQNDQEGTAYGSSGFATPALVENIGAGTATTVSAHLQSRYRYSAIYARLAYNYQDQYLINLTGRRDASSRFGPGRQFANLGAVGIAWVFTKQQIIREALPFLSFGKVRGSYGITGNDQLPNYRFLSTYTASGMSYQDNGMLTPTSLTNPDFGWETVKKLEAGIELGLFQDKIFFSASWYRNRTGNQLVGYSLPSITGFTSIQANLPAVIQNTGKEFELTADVINKNNFKWSASGNVSFPRNKLISYPNIEGSSYNNVYVIGQPLSVAFLYNYLGFNEQTKKFMFEDINGDGAINSQSDRRPYFTGIKYHGGLNNSFSYKGLQLDVFFQFVKQTGYRFDNGAPGIYFSSLTNNKLRSVLDNGRNGEIPPFSQRGSSDASRAYTLLLSSYYGLTDASFIRLKNVFLSYTLPEKYQRIAGLKNAKIYLQGQNLLTFTGFDGIDPEFAAGSLTLPPLKSLSLGIQISL